MLAVATLWHREVIRFVRQRSRLVGALAQPLVFWLLLGGGLSPSFRPPGAPAGASYLAYLYPGILALVLLFTAIVVGQALGGTTLAVGQGLAFLALAPLAGLRPSPLGVLGALGVMVVVAFGLTNLGLLIAWRIESTQGFHAIMNLLLIPIWLLSGAFFPPAGVPAPLAWLMRLDPLTYGLAALRACLDPAAMGLPPFMLSLGVAMVFGAGACAAAVATARRAVVAV